MDDRRDPVLPRLKRVRPSGRESRGRAEGERIRRNDRTGTVGTVRRPRRRHARVLQARRRSLSGAGRGAVAAAGLIAVAGCGSTLSHGEFVKRADAVCSAYTSQIKPRLQPKSYAEIVAYVDKTLPLYEAALVKLEALKPPSSDAQAVKAWLAADRRVARATRDLGIAAERRDFPAVSAAASRAQLAGSQGRQAAAGLGLHVCGSLLTGR